MAEQDEADEGSKALWRKAMEEATQKANALRSLLEHEWLDPTWTSS
jgi:hypothetical protein